MHLYLLNYCYCDLTVEGSDSLNVVCTHNGDTGSSHYCETILSLLEWGRPHFCGHRKIYTSFATLEALRIAQKYDLFEAFGGWNGSVCMAFRDTLGWFTASRWMVVDGGAFCVACAIQDCDAGHMHVLENQCCFADCLYNPVNMKEVLVCCDGSTTVCKHQ